MTIYTKKLTHPKALEKLKKYGGIPNDANTDIDPDTGQMQWDGVDHGNVVDEAHGKFTDQ
jgi:hypothetical protein